MQFSKLKCLIKGHCTTKNQKKLNLKTIYNAKIQTKIYCTTKQRTKKRKKKKKKQEKSIICEKCKVKNNKSK